MMNKVQMYEFRKCHHHWKWAAFTHALYWTDEIILVITGREMTRQRWQRRWQQQRQQQRSRTRMLTINFEEYIRFYLALKRRLI